MLSKSNPSIYAILTPHYSHMLSRRCQNCSAVAQNTQIVQSMEHPEDRSRAYKTLAVAINGRL